MALIYATKKLLERVKKWDASALLTSSSAEDTVLSGWYATYAIIEKQHVVVLVNDPTYLTLVIRAKDFKQSPTESMCKALEPLLVNLQLDGEQIAELLDAFNDVCYLPTQDRSMVSRLNHVLMHVTWRMGEARSPHRISMEMVDELYKAGPLGGNRYDDYQTPRTRLAAELGMDTTSIRRTRDLVEVRIALANQQPEEWYTVLMPVTNDLVDLHLVILACFGWMGTPRHAFYCGHHGRVVDELDVILLDLMGDTTSPLRYVYDPREEWECVITFGQMQPSSVTARAYQVTGGEPEIANLQALEADVRGMVHYVRASEVEKP